MNKQRILFLTLNTFSATGGIEKVCRIAAKAIYELVEDTGDDMTVYSMYDRSKDIETKYLPLKKFKGFNGQRATFVLNAVSKGTYADIVILSHINLLIVGYIIKLFSPKTKLIIIAHGIEIWNILPLWKK